MTTMMTDKPCSEPPRPTYLKDYRPPDFLVDAVELRIELGEELTHVRARLRMRRSPTGASRPLELNGQDIELRSLALDGRPLAPEEYSTGAESLRIFSVPERFVLEVDNELRPQENTSLEGLYRSSGNFCTQCEAEGFRKITYYPDRPDVMAPFRVRIEADRATCPILLSNGNPAGSGDLPDGRHFAEWQDPHPKPAYLFALVAGQLVSHDNSFTTSSGREVALKVYVRPGDEGKCAYAMDSLKRAMRWDEEVYGREYDLDIYMIVAVDDFNMGAMENKGLNIFNSKYVLAKPETATDRDFRDIEGVIGHEYFHNWSGNRVTCRDWFQLSLKEGFTIFRDQQFSADMGSAGVKRIEDVDLLRTHQFREDAGPMAHPVRPDTYLEINNFYTVTVYNKGAEIVRMLHHTVGEDGFRRGTDLYFSRHDGQAVTTEDFVRAMEDANGVELEQFRLWYSQAGTPQLIIKREHDAAAGVFRLDVTQRCPPTPNQTEKSPLHIPLAVALLDETGRALPARLAGEPASAAAETRVLPVRQPHETFVFVDVPVAPVPSLLRGFSAPVTLQTDLGDEALCFLMAHDTDPFARWDAAQSLARKHLLGMVDRRRAGEPLTLDSGFIDAFGAVVASDTPDKAFLALMLELPSETLLAESMTEIDPQAIHESRRYARLALARAHRARLQAHYETLADPGPYGTDPASVGRRSLRNLCLSYLMELDDESVWQLALTQLVDAGNMTDAIAALTTLSNSECPRRVDALAEFYRRWCDEPLVIDKWLSIQACSRHSDTLDVVRSLTGHEAFNIRNPNKVRALLGAFASGNPLCFHRADGAGYRLIGGYVREIDRLNPQVAARLAAAFSQWRRYDATRRELMRAELETTLRVSALSPDVFEIVSKTLA